MDIANAAWDIRCQGTSKSGDRNQQMYYLGYPNAKSFDIYFQIQRSYSIRKYNPTPGSNAVSPYVTLVILVAGVVGGLIIVIAVILFCKYCVKRKKGLHRGQQTSEINRGSERRFKPLQRYETINSDVFSEPSTCSMDGIPISPRRSVEIRNIDKYTESDEATETTKLKTDFDKATYKESDAEGYQETEGEEEEEEDRDKTGRRVSFQLDQSAVYYLRKGRRFTEGDFQYIKKAKVTALPKHHTIDISGPKHTANPLHCENWDPDFHIEEELSDDLETVVRTVENRSPILDFENSPSPTMKPCRTQIAVEVHCESRRSIGGSMDLGRDWYGSRPAPPKSLETTRGRRSRSYSVGVLSPQNISSGYIGRRVRSFEDDVDYDVLKITEFAKGPFFNTDFDVISELGSPCTSKVRYNDTGSIEQLNEVLDFDFYDDFEYGNIIPDENDDTETLNGTQKYRELWNLRSTFEEEEECSDTIRMEDVPSSDQSPDSETPDQNRYFDPNSESLNCDDQDRNCEKEHCSNTLHCKSRSPNRLHPDCDRRRQTYRNMLANRLKPSQNDNKEETSFDSVETVDTDGDVSDTSRHEATSTSFESTTDNTDSTTESQTNRLRQMKADSGYKSLETQQPPGACAGEKKCLSLDEDELVENESRNIVLPDTSASFDFCSRRRNGKTASKRRREYSRERQMVRVYESINEPETDSRSDLPSGDSFDDPSIPNKRSIFTRFFKSQKERRHKSMSRDYSIDEKSDKIFKEFSSYDPRLDNKCSLAVGAHRSPRNHRHRMHRASLDGSQDDRRRDRLAPDMRNGNHGSDSSASSVRRVSPQDSIEEEDYEQVKQALQWENSHGQRNSVGRQSISVHEIPIIKLNEEETADA
ncbi:hypothetical protein ScPMuIL_005567 [Solemya velum]